MSFNVIVYSIIFGGFFVQSNSLVVNEEVVIGFSLIIFFIILFYVGRKPLIVYFYQNTFIMYLSFYYLMIMNIIMSYDGNDFLKYVRMSLKKSGIFSNKLFKRRIEQNRFYINSLASIAKLLITFYLFSASTKLGPGK
jgi:hypothetical protein